MDGSIAVFHFEVKELGYKFTDNEMEDLKKNRYGDTRGRQTSLAESPAQLVLESLAAKQWGGGETQTNIHPQPNSQQAQNNVASIKPQTPSTHVDMGSGQSLNKGAVVTANAPPPPPKEVPTRTSSPVKQREYRRPDGRRRIIPEPVGHQSRDERLVTNGVNAVASTVSGQKRDLDALGSMDTIMTSKDSRKEALPKGGGGNEVAGNHQIGIPSRPRIGIDSSVKEIGLCSTDAAQMGMGSTSVQREIVLNADVKGTKDVLSIVISNNEDADESLPICLEARPLIGGLPDNPETEIICSKCGQVQWKDRLAGKATVIAGNSNIWAVGCDEGTLQVSNDLFCVSEV